MHEDKSGGSPAHKDPQVGKAAWHHMDGDTVLRATASSPAGLTPEEARARLLRVGPNRLTPQKSRGPLLRFLQQFDNLLIYVLLAASLVTAVLGEWVDTGVIVGVVLINALIGFFQEGKAEKSLAAIRALLSLEATVLRGGERLRIPAEELVPGDIVLLESGDKVPADLRLLEARALVADEALLTGESQVVDKHADPVPHDAPLGDRRSMVYSGTLIVAGQGRGVVVATADRTEIGRIGRLLADVEGVGTPLLRQMAVFGQRLTLAILAIALLALGIGMGVHGHDAARMFLAAVGIAVAAVPEGLPAIMTITLAIGVQRMAARRAIVRRMAAVETLGAVNVICSDKTGTLTRNEMCVQRLVSAAADITVSGSGYAPEGGFASGGQPLCAGTCPEITRLAEIGALCNDARLSRTPEGWRVDGDPTEGALLCLAEKAGCAPAALVARRPRRDCLPFSSAHRFMATLHAEPDGGRVCVKGAPEAVLALCAGEWRPNGVAPLDHAFWTARLAELAGEGLRVLALAEAPWPEPAVPLDLERLSGRLVLVGLVGLIDPPRPEAVAAVARCQAAGIDVKMITGDHAITARAIAARLGIGSNGRVLCGAEIETLDDAALCRAVADTDVFARASPEHKLRLVRALQASGAVVAMTGDGVNDAPALKQADVGVAMGQKGTEAAKEAAEIVLADDNFATIAAAVEEGRTVYDNLRKAILYVLPTSSGQAAMVLLAVLFGLTLPITPVQILWVNMVTAVTLSLAFAFEKPEADVMQRPPRRPDAALVDAFMLWRIVFVTLLMVLAAFGIFLWEEALGRDIATARSAAINALVVAEMFYLFNCRSLLGPILNRAGLFGNRLALWAVGLLILVQIAFTYLPAMQHLFHTAPLDAGAWLRIVLAGLAILLCVEAEKYLLAHRPRRGAAD